MKQQSASVVKMEQDMLRPAFHIHNAGTKQRIFKFPGLHVNGLLSVHSHARNRNIYKMLAEQPSVILHFRQFRH
ncbi:hypothetical protein D3C73_1077870 [compost metagenome]